MVQCCVALGIEKKRANFKQQRSYSFNDLSPAVESEKWEKEAVSEMVAEATKHKKKNRQTNIDAGKERDRVLKGHTTCGCQPKQKHSAS